ncbi:hypothetical protein ElyMa_003893300 [Elysia marginata]|uniref:Uncharacterized protein n=1 Tax=Elysia marginata TaxID=1093978 RepID=A0AAV4FMK0_9GAST|nr:hypothetical protein ElyMa_003893300 [Elysia marginata]
MQILKRIENQYAVTDINTACEDYFLLTATDRPLAVEKEEKKENNGGKRLKVENAETVAEAFPNSRMKHQEWLL